MSPSIALSLSLCLSPIRLVTILLLSRPLCHFSIESNEMGHSLRRLVSSSSSGLKSRGVVEFYSDKIKVPLDRRYHKDWEHWQSGQFTPSKARRDGTKVVLIFNLILLCYYYC